MKEREVMKKIIIFDMDGVILDSEPLHETARVMIRERLGIAQAEGLPDPVGANSCEHWRMVLAHCGLEGDPVALELEQYALVARQVRENHVPPNPGLLETLEWARENGVKVGLASSSTRALVEEVLELLHIRQYFDYTVAGDEVANKKPAPDPYLRVLELSGLKAEDAVAVEDSKNGVKSACNAGIFCFGYLTGDAEGQDLSMADTVIRRLDEIIGIDVGV